MRIPCTVILKEVGPTRLRVIAALRDLKPDFSIPERQNYLHHLPRIVESEIDEHRAESIARDLRDAGAVVEIEKPIFSTKMTDWLKEKCDLEALRSDQSFDFEARSAWEVLGEEMQPDDEIWTFSSPDIFWKNLCGRAGYALVRDGQIVSSVLTAMN